ncbi:MAG: hypothetical protein ACMXYK_01975 [Candidatus Woesearchaeota archaeon]
MLARLSTESPIAVTEWRNPTGFTVIRLQNTGTSPIRLQETHIDCLTIYADPVLRPGQEQAFMLPFEFSIQTSGLEIEYLLDNVPYTKSYGFDLKESCSQDVANLKGYWRADGRGKDSSPYQRDLILHDGATFSTFQNQPVISTVNGGYIELPWNASDFHTGHLALGYQYYLNEIASTQNCHFGPHDGANYLISFQSSLGGPQFSEYIIRATNTNICRSALFRYTETDSNSATGGGSLLPETTINWNFLYFSCGGFTTVDSNICTVSTLNTAFSGSPPRFYALSESPIFLGGRPAQPDAEFDGYFRDIILFNQSKTTEELSSLFP